MNLSPKGTSMLIIPEMMTILRILRSAEVAICLAVSRGQQVRAANPEASNRKSLPSLILWSLWCGALWSWDYQIPGACFNITYDILSNSQMLKIGIQSFPIALKFDRHLGSFAAEPPAKHQSDVSYLTRNGFEILWDKMAYWILKRQPGFWLSLPIHVAPHLRAWFNNIICPHININTLRQRQNRRHFADDIFKCIFLNENVWIPIKISLMFVSKGPINNIPAMVPIMAWRRAGDKPLSEPMVVSLPTHICVARPQWVKISSNQCS